MRARTTRSDWSNCEGVAVSCMCLASKARWLALVLVLTCSATFTSAARNQPARRGRRIQGDALSFDYGALPDTKPINRTAEAEELVRLWTAQPQHEWRIFIMFQHNIEMLQQAVRSYHAASKLMTPSMIIIDNSPGQDAHRDEYIRTTVHEVVLTPNRLNFPQLHNFMADLALKRRLNFYFWAHADDYVLPKTADGE